MEFDIRLATIYAVTAAAMFIAGCSGTPTQTSSLPAQAAATGSWMAPDAKKNDLLYVSDLDTDDVYVFSYPKGALVGTLKGFDAVHGGCVDKHGDVFLPNAGDSEIIEYAHGGSKPIATLQDASQSPVGCSVNPKTGDLAVANFGGSGPGNIAIYAHAQGYPTFYLDQSVFLYYDCAYDDQGNIYVSGGDMNGNFKFAELPSGATSFTNISLNQQIFVPGGVQWDGKYVAVEDQGAGYKGSTIYQFSISGSAGTEVGTTTLGGSTDVIRFWIDHKRVIGGNIGSSPNVMFWRYPRGGNSTKTITGVKEPVGVTVSRGRS
jgi:hypothetical protein